MVTPDEVRARVVTRAWEDAAFYNKLIENPRDAIKLMGEEITLFADEHDISIVLEQPNSLTIVLPPHPSASEPISEGELNTLAMMAGGQTMQGPNCATHSYTRPCSRECK